MLPGNEEKIIHEIGPNLKDVLMSLISTLLKTDDPVEMEEPETKHGIGDAFSFNGQSCPKCGGNLFETGVGAHCVNGDFQQAHGTKDAINKSGTDAVLKTELDAAKVAAVYDDISEAFTAATNPWDKGPANPLADIAATEAIVRESIAGSFNEGIPTPPPPPPAANTTVKLADGIPHDIRIHASTQTVYAKAPHGWKLKRGVDPALVETVTTELRAAMSIPAHVPGTAADLGDALIKARTDAIAGNVPAPTATEKMMAAYKDGFDGRDAAAGNVPPPPPPPPPKRVITEDVKAVQRIAESGHAAPITTFAEFVAAMTPALASGQLTQATIDAELAAIGLQSIPLLGARQDLIPVLAAKLFPGV